MKDFSGRTVIAFKADNLSSREFFLKRKDILNFGAAEVVD